MNIMKAAIWFRVLSIAIALPAASIGCGSAVGRQGAGQFERGASSSSALARGRPSTVKTVYWSDSDGTQGVTKYDASGATTFSFQIEHIATVKLHDAVTVQALPTRDESGAMLKLPTPEPEQPPPDEIRAHCRYYMRCMAESLRIKDLVQFDVCMNFYIEECTPGWEK